MTTSPNSQQRRPQAEQPSTASDPILCPHCKRTESNGIKCKGICVADNDY